MHATFSFEAEEIILITNNEEYGYLASAYVAILNSSSNRWSWPASTHLYGYD